MRFSRFFFAHSVILCLGVSLGASIDASENSPPIAGIVQPSLTENPASEGTSDDEKQGTEAAESSLTLRDITYLLAPILSLVGVGLIVYFTRRNTISEQWLKINSLEVQYIQDKLDKFYGPFILESQANHLMAQDLRGRQPEPMMYRLLDKLFDEEWRSSLSKGDEVLVEEICSMGERLSSVIKEHSGLVDPLLLPYVARAITHFRVLKLACEKKLGSDSKPFLRYVYPKTLDAALEKELNRLQDRMRLLRKNPNVSHSDMPNLDLSDCPLDSWPDHPRPDVDPGTGELTPHEGGSGSLMQPPGS